MRLNIGKKLKTASLNSKFTGSKREKCTSTCSLLKILKPKDLELLLTGASISQNLWGGPTCNNQNFFGEILRISFALLVRRNSTFDAVFFFFQY